MRKDEFKKIAVLKPSALGDFIFALPALNALRKAYPKSEIVYLGRKWHKTFLSERKSLIDRVIVVPPAAGVGMEDSYNNDEEKLKHFFQKMRKENFDLAIQLHGGGRFSNPFLLNLGARFNIGAKTLDAVSLDRTIPYEYYQSEYLRWLEVVSLLDLKLKGIEIRLKVLPADLAEAKMALKKNRKKIIVIHPGAKDIRRRWPPKKFAEVGDYFGRLGFRIVITGSGSERGIVNDVISRMKHKADNFYSRLSINGLTGLLYLSKLVISNDTGPLHLAYAAGAKTLGIYWCGNLINGGPLFRKNSRCLISWMIFCPLCGKDCVSRFPFRNSSITCRHEAPFVEAVEAEDVIRAALGLLLI